MTTSRHQRRWTIDEWQQQPPEKRYELIDGDLIEKAAPDMTHGVAQAGLVARLFPAFHRRGGGGGGPGGWWLATEVDIQLGEDGYRPDVSGWRRDRLPALPTTRPVTVLPDWICEVISESNATTDTIRKLRRYHAAGVPHYWLLDPATRTLVVYRHALEGYRSLLIAESGETVRAEPFDAVELRISALFGDVDNE